jgi:hypothetical protein
MGHCSFAVFQLTPKPVLSLKHNGIVPGGEELAGID